MKKKIIIALVFIMICVVFGVFLNNIIHKNKILYEKKQLYQEAIKFQESEEYEKAINILIKIKDYNDSDTQLIKTYHMLAKKQIEKEQYKEAIELLEKCNNYEDSVSLLVNIKYKYAMQIMNSNEKEAIQILRTISSYEDSESYIKKYEFAHRFDGTYSDKRDFNNARIIINGLNTKSKVTLYMYYNEHTLGDYKYSAGYSSSRENEWICSENLDTCTLTTNDTVDTYIFSENKVTMKVHYIAPKHSWYKDFEVVYEKISEDLELPQKMEILGSNKPKIGMSEVEVRNSSWGKPKDINKSTYSWGTTEQWVYEDNKYIYFKNGKVTSISE